jgi:hypothetical protein
MEIQQGPPQSTTHLEQCFFILVLQFSKEDCIQCLEAISIYQCALLFSFQGDYVPTVSVTSMEVSAEALRRKGHKRVFLVL